MKVKKIVQWSVLLALALVVLTAPATLAAGTSGSGPDTAIDAATISGEQESLAPGASVWYAVTYHGGMQDELDLSTNSVGGVSFAVYTPDEVATWASTGVLTPIGVGTYNQDEPNYDLTWSGHPVSVDGTTYYVVVTNNNTSATQYQLIETGWLLSTSD